MTARASDRITVFTAEDHPLFLEGVNGLLATAADLVPVGSAASGSAALAMICEIKPAIAVLDVSMPEIDGISVARLLAKRVPGTQTIMLTAGEEQSLVHKAIEAGARGYVLKRSAGEHLLMAIRSVNRGGFYIDPAIAGRMMPGFGRPGTRHCQREATLTLTPREAEVLRLIALGYTLKEIAGSIGVTMKSIETYKVRATEKMQLGSRAKIVQFAMVQGWFQDDGGGFGALAKFCGPAPAEVN